MEYHKLTFIEARCSLTGFLRCFQPDVMVFISRFIHHIEGPNFKVMWQQLFQLYGQCFKYKTLESLLLYVVDLFFTWKGELKTNLQLRVCPFNEIPHPNREF